MGQASEKLPYPLHGVFPPLMTPFKDNGDVDYTAFERNLERFARARLAGYLVLGSNSEAAYLSREEKLELMKLTVKRAHDRPVLAGTGMESLRETLRLTEDAAKRGVQGALVLTPSYYTDAMTDIVLIRFFSELADRSPIPIFIYNVPKFTHVNISAAAVAELSRHPNIAGMKDSTGNIAQIESFLKIADPAFQIIVGTAGVFFPALQLGLTACIAALSNCLPDLCAEIQTLFEAGNVEAARKLQFRLLPVNQAVTAIYGVAGLKYAATLMGYEGGRVRSPLLPLTEEGERAMEGILRTAEMLQ